jgi:hypothetical protein
MERRWPAPRRVRRVPDHESVRGRLVGRRQPRDLPIERYELPNLAAVNFLIRGLLGTGATSTLRLDAQAKALGEWLRSRSVKVPASVVPA